MASKGKGDNPFSFKAFINKREGGSDGGGIHKQYEEKEGKKRKKKEEKQPEKEVEGKTTLYFMLNLVLLGNPFSFKNFIKKSENDRPHPRAPPTTNDNDDSPFTTDEEDDLPGLPPPPILSDPANLKSKIPHKIEKDIFASSSSSDSEDDPLPSKLHEIPLSDPILAVSDPLRVSEQEESEAPLNINPFPEVAMIVPDESKHDLVLEINQVIRTRKIITYNDTLYCF